MKNENQEICAKCGQVEEIHPIFRMERIENKNVMKIVCRKFTPQNNSPHSREHAKMDSSSSDDMQTTSVTSVDNEPDSSLLRASASGSYDNKICVNCGKTEEKHFDYGLCFIEDVNSRNLDYGKKFKPKEELCECGHGKERHIEDMGCNQCQCTNFTPKNPNKMEETKDFVFKDKESALSAVIGIMMGFDINIEDLQETGVL